MFCCGLSWTPINIFIKDTDDELENTLTELSDDNKQGKDYKCFGDYNFNRS